MTSSIALTGEYVPCDIPYWTPLEGVLSRERCQHYMWMGEILLENGLTIHAYKHYNTRRYLHIGVDGSSWLYDYGNRYTLATVPPEDQHDEDVRELEIRQVA